MTLRRALIGCGVLLALGVIVVVAVFVGVIIGNNNKDNTASSPSPEQDSTTQPAAKAPPSPAPKTASGQVEGNLNEPIDLRSRVLTVNEAERNYQSGQPGGQPPAGDEFVRVNLTLENTSSSDNVSLNPLEFKVEDSTGVQNPYRPMPRMPNAISSSSLAPGGKTTGNLVFPVAQGDPNLKLIYQPIGINLGGASIALQ
jgi:hypothetical protein